MARWMSQHSLHMSSRFTLRPLKRARPSLWTICAPTRSTACARRSRPSVQACAIHRPTRQTSTRSSWHSHSSKRPCARARPAPSRHFGSRSASSPRRLRLRSASITFDMPAMDKDPHQAENANESVSWCQTLLLNFKSLNCPEPRAYVCRNSRKSIHSQCFREFGRRLKEDTAHIQEFPRNV